MRAALGEGASGLGCAPGRAAPRRTKAGRSSPSERLPSAPLSHPRQGLCRARALAGPEMPLLHRKPFERRAPPADLRPEEEVFYCRVTREIFRRYE